MQTPREIVQRTLRFEHPERLPIHLWELPWLDLNHPEEAKRLRADYPADIMYAPAPYRSSPRRSGDPYAVGKSTDEWGCEFENLQAGIIGEVRRPILEDLEDAAAYEPPYEILPEDWEAGREQVNAFCAATDRFVMAGSVPRDWERYQFLRGSTEAFCDFADPDEDVLALLHKIHDYHRQEIAFWASTNVDGIMLMDDWGSQQTLLINPATWRAHFKPLYAEFCRIAHDHGKFVFLHSDGNIAMIYQDLIDIGINAVNSQLFVMDIEELGRRFRGQITFWGEIDRQFILIQQDEQIVRDAVRRVARSLYDPSGGIIIQFELTPGMHLPHADVVIDEWKKIHGEALASS